MTWARTTIYYESKKLERHLNSGGTIESFSKSLGCRESEPDTIEERSNYYYDMVNDYRDQMRNQWDKDWYAEHPVNENHLLDVGRYLDDWYWAIRQKMEDEDAKKAEE